MQNLRHTERAEDWGRPGKADTPRPHALLGQSTPFASCSEHVRSITRCLLETPKCRRNSHRKTKT